MSALPESECNECSMSTQHKCVECNVPYCSKCFDEVHAAGKILKRHKIVPINAILPRTHRLLSPCKHHNNKMDHYCQTCKVPICHLCSNEAHSKHDTTKIISNEKVDLDEMMNILKFTQEKIDETNRIALDLINEISNTAASNAEDISKEFHHYHAILQNIEKDALIELKKRTFDYMQNMHQVQNRLRLSSEQVEMAKSRVIEFSKNVPADIDLATLHGEVMCLLEVMPIELIIEHIDENLFSFDVPDFDQSAVRSAFQVMFKENRFSPKWNSFSAERHSEDDSDVTLVCDKASLNKNQKMENQAASKDASNTSSPQSQRSLKSLKSTRIKNREVCVVEMKDPKTFFVQNIEFLETAEVSAAVSGKSLLESAVYPENDDDCKTKVSAWVPANPIGKYQFTAIPTYVGDNAVIYLHATSQMEYVEQLKFTINNQLQNIPCDMSQEWKVGDICMVRYHLDDCFYRGVIKDVLPEKQFKIEFVDYGNIEECNQCDIREANILENVPIQATKYYLPFLKPKTENGFWDQSILEFIHSNIVNKMVGVRVALEDEINEEYIPCSITVGGMNMHEVMIAENLADHTCDANIIFQHALHSDIDYCEDSHETADRDQNEQNISSNKLEEIVTEKSEIEKQKECIAQFNSDNLRTDVVVDDADEIFKETSLLSNDNSVEFDFDPMDNSTEISNRSPVTLSFHPFMQFKPSEYIKKMSAIIIDIIDPVHLVLQPIIEEFNYNWEQMEQKNKRTPHESTEKFNFKQNRACLAQYDVDDCYYRAIIEDPFYINDSVRVIFVDYLETKIVERKFIRQCPVEVVEQPLKYFIVKLHVTPYPRIRDNIIMNSLEEFKDKNVILKIVKHHTSPKTVHLYDKDNENMLIYQSLIDQMFYKQC